MDVLILIRKSPKLNVDARYRAGNLEAARIIIANPKYQGLLREIAERMLANAQAERSCDVLLADEASGQRELFATEGGGSWPQR